VVGERDVARRLHGDGVGQRVGGRGLRAVAGAEVDLEPGARERHREARAPRVGADDGGAADARRAAQPLPLQLDAGPDAIGHRGGQVAAGLGHLRKGQGRAGADADLVRADAPAPAHGLRADDGDGDHGDAGLEREAPDAALGTSERAGARARAFGEDEDAVAACEDRLGGGHRLLVAALPIDRVRAERRQQPGRRPVDEGLLLRHEVDRPAGHDGDDEGVQEGPVVGRDDERPLRRDVLAPDAAQAPVQVEERLQDRAQPPVHERVDAAPARAIQKGVAIHALDTRH
jgi:hypothetical protein